MADDQDNGGEGHNSRKVIDFEGAARLMKSDVATATNKAAKIRGDQSALWKRIEEKGVNKKAAKVVQGLLSQSPATVSDYLRTFIGLLNPCGLGILKDMVDDAEGKTFLEVPLIDTPSVDA